MSSENGHGHEHDTHYHGEPSRVLDDQPLPETVVFYEAGPGPSSDLSDEAITDRIETWISQLEDQGNVKRAYLGSHRDVESTGSIELHAVDRSQLDPFAEDFDGLPEGLLQEPGLLFLPVQLALSEGAWTDLKANDVSVNWLSVLPDPKKETDLPKVIVLSDWIADLGDDVPGARSTGVTPGIVHVKKESLEVFNEIARTTESLELVLREFLDREGEKIRPGFLRGREWRFE